MFHHHRAIAIVCLVAALAAMVIAIRAGSSAPRSASLTWGPAPGATAAPGTAGTIGTPSAIPVPQASPSPSAASALGALQVPLSAMFQQLNNETRNTAIGQYTILQEIGNTIRDNVSRYLTSVTGGR